MKLTPKKRELRSAIIRKKEEDGWVEIELTFQDKESRTRSSLYQINPDKLNSYDESPLSSKLEDC